MSRIIEPHEIVAVIREYGLEPYIVMNQVSRPPRVMHVGVCLEERGNEVVLTASCGRAAGDRLAASPEVAFLWPSSPHNTMNLIVDARLAESAGPAAELVADAPIDFVVQGAVFHRPAESAQNC